MILEKPVAGPGRMVVTAVVRTRRFRRAVIAAA
jgi:hypothetical protein